MADRTTTPSRSRSALLAAAGGALLAAVPAAQIALPAEPEFRIHVPSNTGLPGTNNVLFVDFGPDGRLWAGARDAFWQQGGAAALDLGTGSWETYSNVETTLAQWNYDVAFGPDGAAWVVGDDSVNRIDGSGVTLHQPGDGALVEGPYTAVAVGSDGHVWAANSGSVQTGGGLFEYDGATWIQHHEPWMESWTGGVAPGLAVVVRPNGDVWASFAAVGGSGLGLYDGSAWMQATGAPTLLDFAETPDGTLYGVNGFGTYRLNEATGHWEQVGTLSSSNLVADGTTGRLYLGTGSQVWSFDGSTWSLFAQLPSTVRSIAIAPNGEVWIAAEVVQGVEAIFQHDASGALLRGYDGPNTGIPDYLLDDTYCDRQGRMWFVSGEYGGTRLDPGENYRNFGQWNLDEEVFPFDLGPGQLLAEGISGVYQDRAGNTWLTGNGAARSQGDDLSQWDLWYWQNSILPSGFLSEIGEDENGNVYIGGDFVAYRFDGTQWETAVVGNPSQFSPIGFEQGLDGLLYATRIGTVYRVEAGAFVPVFDYDSGVVTDVAVDANGVVWAGTPDGLFRVDGATETMFTPANSGLAEARVADVEIRADGLVAVLTDQLFFAPYDGGLAIYDGVAWAAFDYGESALPFYQNGGLSFDADGDLWMTSVNYGAVEVALGTQQLCQLDLGYGGPGMAVLDACGSGPLTHDATIDLRLESAPPSAPALLVAGLTQNPLPFAGGTIVPLPPLAVLALTTDGAGELVLPIAGVSAGVSFDLYVQFAVLDPSQPQGFQISNAVALQFLP